MQQPLSELLEYLATESLIAPTQWRGWQLTPIAGGANNRVYRAQSGDSDYAIKWTIRDERRRAWREYQALQALAKADRVLAPQAVWLDEASFAQPVVVQTWLDYPALTNVPQAAAQWQGLVEHYWALRQISQATSKLELPLATLNMHSVAVGKHLIAEHCAKLPAAQLPAELEALLVWLETWAAPEFSSVPLSLCRVDSNWRNFLQTPTGFVSVDWENAGWGDPAFEIVDLMTHPAYATVTLQQWQAFVTAYCRFGDDPSASQRIEIYRTLMLIWWVVRWQRYLYEVPRGLDARLVERPPAWLTTAQANYQRYLDLAQQAIKQWR
ncbi:phosphotransferase [Herpetosiphon sp. NSE202]|uniref:phosphotransferase n=1 Tax=Herpetosiphon sp. NSE202 TaxID=3351349 RepID=UPI003627DCFB